MKLKYIFFFLIAPCAYSQQSPQKGFSPLIGWDSLIARIVYPEIATRAGLEGAFRARTSIDSIGNLEQLEVLYLNDTRSSISYSDSILVKAIIRAFDGIKWKPNISTDKNYPVKFSIPIVFLLTTSYGDTARYPLVIIKNVKRPRVLFSPMIETTK
jgi:Gram-negative bacterial TonB protein C-terminal